MNRRHVNYVMEPIREVARRAETRRRRRYSKDPVQKATAARFERWSETGRPL